MPVSYTTFTFSLACAVPGANDASFNISGTSLRTSAVFDFEAKSTYNLCIRVADQGGLTFDKKFTISVKDINEATNTPGKVTGGGNLDLAGGKAAFGFVIQYAARDASPSGNLTFIDHAAKLRLKATSFDRLVIDGNHATLSGSGVLDDGRAVSFTVKVTTGPDTFFISIPALNGYETGGALTGGNIKISTR